MNVFAKFSYEQEASKPLRDGKPTYSTRLGAVTRKPDFCLLWTTLVKKQMMYIVAQITPPRYSQTPHQFFASGHITLF
jgi:hypothetical protein